MAGIPSAWLEEECLSVLPAQAGAWGLEPAPLGHEEAKGTVYPPKQGFEAGLVTYGVCRAGDSRRDVPYRTRERHLHCLASAPRGALV